MSTTATPPDISRQAQTCARLLEAAAQEFADHGFHHATVREICRKADANVAAVNYHFGDKCGLYSATLKHWIVVSLEKFPPLMGVPADAPAADRLRGFVLGSLSRMLDTGSAGWHGQLMAREMVEPTEAFDELVQETLRPMSELLHGIVRDIAGGDVNEQVVRSCAMSVIGQCCFYKHSREVVTRLFGDAVYGADFLQTTADHITRFSIAGIHAATASKKS
ncbi:CerR family C-terminal domain-containing protein [Humisphaera borealis]|uniref:CerR family C-terminal domain-containing protein n=1 Tax=Humisphaera borealis TaxID=2807512 RepID=A0A7M2X183_9BACT|nr:CerR family C-terminal domain-containing protein [Humisphaera borealis]QOV91202.1 CerR family C-terminal domain-containing protein [Humisphaera borealis]